MPAWLLRLLPHFAIALALLAGVAWIDHLGYQRAKDDQVALEARLTAKITEGLAAIDAKSAARLAGIDRQERTIIQPIVTREIASDPRYSDPRCALTDGLLGAANRARAASASAGADLGAVPGAGAAD